MSNHLGKGVCMKLFTIPNENEKRVHRYTCMLPSLLDNGDVVWFEDIVACQINTGFPLCTWLDVHSRSYSQAPLKWEKGYGYDDGETVGDSKNKTIRDLISDLTKVEGEKKSLQSTVSDLSSTISNKSLEWAEKIETTKKLFDGVEKEKEKIEKERDKTKKLLATYKQTVKDKEKEIAENKKRLTAMQKRVDKEINLAMKAERELEKIKGGK